MSSRSTPRQQHSRSHSPSPSPHRPSQTSPTSSPSRLQLETPNLGLDEFGLGIDINGIGAGPDTKRRKRNKDKKGSRLTESSNNNHNINSSPIAPQISPTDITHTNTTQSYTQADSLSHPTAPVFNTSIFPQLSSQRTAPVARPQSAFIDRSKPSQKSTAMPTTPVRLPAHFDDEPDDEYFNRSSSKPNTPVRSGPTTPSRGPSSQGAATPSLSRGPSSQGPAAPSPIASPTRAALAPSPSGPTFSNAPPSDHPFMASRTSASSQTGPSPRKLTGHPAFRLSGSQGPLPSPVRVAPASPTGPTPPPRAARATPSREEDDTGMRKESVALSPMRNTFGEMPLAPPSPIRSSGQPWPSRSKQSSPSGLNSQPVTPPSATIRTAQTPSPVILNTPSRASREPVTPTVEDVRSTSRETSSRERKQQTYNNRNAQIYTPTSSRSKSSRQNQEPASPGLSSSPMQEKSSSNSHRYTSPAALAASPDLSGNSGRRGSIARKPAPPFDLRPQLGTTDSTRPLLVNTPSSAGAISEEHDNGGLYDQQQEHDHDPFIESVPVREVSSSDSDDSDKLVPPKITIDTGSPTAPITTTVDNDLDDYYGDNASVNVSINEKEEPTFTSPFPAGSTPKKSHKSQNSPAKSHKSRKDRDRDFSPSKGKSSGLDIDDEEGEKYGSAISRRSNRVKLEKVKKARVERVKPGTGAVRRKPFQSTRLKEEIYKPWLEKKDPALRWARWITIVSILIGFAVCGLICYDGYASVPKLGNVCSVLSDDFSSGTINPSTWTHEVRLDGYGHGEFEWTTNSPNNSFIQNGVLYLVPTLTSDVIGVDAVTNGYTLNLTADGTCTSTNVSQCVAVSNSSQLTVINPVRSARLTTRNSVNLKYGKVEVVAKYPTGDWLWPMISLVSLNNTYGIWPRSGEIDILTGRGNNASYPTRGVDYAESILHWGPTVDLDRSYLTWGYREQRRTYFNQEFHTYGLEWNSNYMWTYIDSRVSQVMSLRFGQSFWNRGSFPSTITNRTTGDVVKLQDPWINSPNNVAPFDQAFYLSLSLGVGATDGWFPDGEGGKPWLDNSGTAMSDFWIAKDKWWNNWGTDPTKKGFAIKSVKMWQTC